MRLRDGVGGYSANRHKRQKTHRLKHTRRTVANRPVRTFRKTLTREGQLPILFGGVGTFHGDVGLPKLPNLFIF